MNEPQKSPQEYLATLPDRIMEVAGEYDVVQIQIAKAYLPLMAADIIRGQTARIGETPEEGLHSYLLEEKNMIDEFVPIKIPSQMAKVLAHDLKVGQHIRARNH